MWFIDIISRKTKQNAIFIPVSLDFAVRAAAKQSSPVLFSCNDSQPSYHALNKQMGILFLSSEIPLP